MTTPGQAVKWQELAKRDTLNRTDIGLSREQAAEKAGMDAGAVFNPVTGHFDLPKGTVVTVTPTPGKRLKQNVEGAYQGSMDISVGQSNQYLQVPTGYGSLTTDTSGMQSRPGVETTTIKNKVSVPAEPQMSMAVRQEKAARMSMMPGAQVWTEIKPKPVETTKGSSLFDVLNRPLGQNKVFSMPSGGVFDKPGMERMGEDQSAKLEAEKRRREGEKMFEWGHPTPKPQVEVQGGQTKQTFATHVPGTTKNNVSFIVTPTMTTKNEMQKANLPKGEIQKSYILQAPSITVTANKPTEKYHFPAWSTPAEIQPTQKTQGEIRPAPVSVKIRRTIEESLTPTAGYVTPKPNITIDLNKKIGGPITLPKIDVGGTIKKMGEPQVVKDRENIYPEVVSGAKAAGEFVLGGATIIANKAIEFMSTEREQKFQLNTEPIKIGGEFSLENLKIGGTITRMGEPQVVVEKENIYPEVKEFVISSGKKVVGSAEKGVEYVGEKVYVAGEKFVDLMKNPPEQKFQLPPPMKIGGRTNIELGGSIKKFGEQQTAKERKNIYPEVKKEIYEGVSFVGEKVSDITSKTISLFENPPEKSPIQFSTTPLQIGGPADFSGFGLSEQEPIKTQGFRKIELPSISSSTGTPEEFQAKWSAEKVVSELPEGLQAPAMKLVSRLRGEAEKEKQSTKSFRIASDKTIISGEQPFVAEYGGLDWSETRPDYTIPEGQKVEFSAGGKWYVLGPGPIPRNVMMEQPELTLDFPEETVLPKGGGTKSNVATLASESWAAGKGLATMARYPGTSIQSLLENKETYVVLGASALGSLVTGTPAGGIVSGAGTMTVLEQGGKVFTEPSRTLAKLVVNVAQFKLFDYVLGKTGEGYSQLKIGLKDFRKGLDVIKREAKLKGRLSYDLTIPGAKVGKPKGFVSSVSVFGEETPEGLRYRARLGGELEVGGTKPRLETSIIKKYRNPIEPTFGPEQFPEVSAPAIESKLPVATKIDVEGARTIPKTVSLKSGGAFDMTFRPEELSIELNRPMPEIPKPSFVVHEYYGTKQKTFIDLEGTLGKARQTSVNLERRYVTTTPPKPTLTSPLQRSDFFRKTDLGGGMLEYTLASSEQVLGKSVKKGKAVTWSVSPKSVLEGLTPSEAGWKWLETGKARMVVGRSKGLGKNVREAGMIDGTKLVLSETENLAVETPVTFRGKRGALQKPLVPKQSVLKNLDKDLRKNKLKKKVTTTSTDFTLERPVLKQEIEVDTFKGFSEEKGAEPFTSTTSKREWREGNKLYRVTDIKFEHKWKGKGSIKIGETLRVDEKGRFIPENAAVEAKGELFERYRIEKERLPELIRISELKGGGRKTSITKYEWLGTEGNEIEIPDIKGGKGRMAPVKKGGSGLDDYLQKGRDRMKRVLNENPTQKMEEYLREHPEVLAKSKGLWPDTMPVSHDIRIEKLSKIVQDSLGKVKEISYSERKVNEMYGQRYGFKTSKTFSDVGFGKTIGQAIQNFGKGMGESGKKEFRTSNMEWEQSYKKGNQELKAKELAKDNEALLKDFRSLRQDIQSSVNRKAEEGVSGTRYDIKKLSGELPSPSSRSIMPQTSRFLQMIQTQEQASQARANRGTRMVPRIWVEQVETETPLRYPKGTPKEVMTQKFIPRMTIPITLRGQVMKQYKSPVMTGTMNQVMTQEKTGLMSQNLVGKMAGKMNLIGTMSKAMNQSMKMNQNMNMIQKLNQQMNQTMNQNMSMNQVMNMNQVMTQELTQVQTQKQLQKQELKLKMRMKPGITLKTENLLEAPGKPGPGPGETGGGGGWGLSISGGGKPKRGLFGLKFGKFKYKPQRTSAKTDWLSATVAELGAGRFMRKVRRTPMMVHKFREEYKRSPLIWRFGTAEEVGQKPFKARVKKWRPRA